MEELPSTSKEAYPSTSKEPGKNLNKETCPNSSEISESCTATSPSSSKTGEPSSSKTPQPSSSKDSEASTSKKTKENVAKSGEFLGDLDSSFDSDSEDAHPSSLADLLKNRRDRPDLRPFHRYLRETIFDYDRAELEELFDIYDDDDDDDFDNLDDDFNSHHVEVPLFPQNPEEENRRCEVCYDMTTIRKRLCCDLRVCDSCVDFYVEEKVREGVVKISCMAACDSFIYRDEILGRLSPELKDKYYKFLIDANKDPYIKTCPRCSHIKQVSKAELDDKIVVKKGLQVSCEKCELKWCFPCHSPWHSDLTCKEFRKGDRLLQMWAQEIASGQVNAQKCPRCKVFIQKTSGCDHMTCSSCKTSFCYRCGKQYRSLKMFGNHFSRYSLFGCKYNLLPKRPGARRFVRGAVFGGKLLGSAVLASLALAAGAVFIGTSVVVVPAIVGYKLMKRRKIRRRAKQRLQSMVVNPHLNSDLRMQVHEVLTYENRNLHGDPMDIFDDDILTREERNWVMLSRLEDEQQVEVLVHRTLGASSSEASESTREPTRAEESSKDKPVVTVTNITEELSEEGYTRVIAHVVAKNSEEHSPKNSVTLAEQASKDTVKDSMSIDSKSDQTTRKSSKSSEGEPEPSDLDLDLTEDSNGCFVNIFSKKLNAWQVHNTLPNASNISAKTLLKMKSGTWEKSGKKLSNSSSFDIKTFSNILNSQSCDLSDIPQCSSAPEEENLSPCDFVTRL